MGSLQGNIRKKGESMISLKPIDDDNMEFARKLRNKNRGYFWDKRIITPKRHERWYRSVKNTEGYYFYIIYLKDVPIGTISWQGKRTGNAIIDKKYRHKGYFAEAVKELKLLHPGPMFVIVKPNHKIKLKIYKKLGFKTKMTCLFMKT